MSRKRITIEDVAKRAGVSKVTVSYVLNGRGQQARISAATEERVYKAADELEYRPNALARMLIRNRADSIAIAFQHANYFTAPSGFISEVMRGVCAACIDLDEDLILHTKHATPGRVEADNLSDGRVDGVLILRDSDDPTLVELLRREVPCVLFFTRSNGDVPYVDADNHSGGRIACEHLLDLGHRRIAVIRGSSNSVSSNDRFDGYVGAMVARGLTPDPRNEFRIASPGETMEPLIERMREPDRPTALFVWSDDVAFAVMRSLNELGLKIPEDVSIVGFDSTANCERVHPPLTSVRQPIFEIARTATANLVALTRNETLKQRQVVFPLELEVRASTARPPRP